MNEIQIEEIGCVPCDDRIKELTRQRDARARQGEELAFKLKQQERDFNTLLAGYKENLQDGKIGEVIASITTILIG